MAKIDERKDAHIRICKEGDVEYMDSAGFEDVQFVHNALPELSLHKVDCSASFLGKKLSAPILITGMTGGTEKGGQINKLLANAAQEKNVALGLGSSRPMLEDEAKAKYYMVRKEAPSIPIIANIGAVQLKEYNVNKIEAMIQKIEADALAVHLNALQEAIQPEGQTDFEGVLSKIEKLCEGVGVPVIAKETGAGINGDVAKMLFDAGIKYVEVSGKGGTSWSKVEYERGGRLPGFEEWGYPTTLAVAECSMFGNTICSGGVRDGIDAAKGIALGAKLSGAAMPFLKAKKPEAEIQKWIDQLKTCMFLAGAKNIDALSRTPLLVSGKSAKLMELRGIEPADFARRGGQDKKKRMGKENANYYL